MYILHEAAFLIPYISRDEWMIDNYDLHLNECLITFPLYSQALLNIKESFIAFSDLLDDI